MEAALTARQAAIRRGFLVARAVGWFRGALSASEKPHGDPGDCCGHEDEAERPAERGCWDSDVLEAGREDHERDDRPDVLVRRARGQQRPDQYRRHAAQNDRDGDTELDVTEDQGT